MPWPVPAGRRVVGRRGRDDVRDRHAPAAEVALAGVGGGSIGSRPPRVDRGGPGRLLAPDAIDPCTDVGSHVPLPPYRAPVMVRPAGAPGVTPTMLCASAPAARKAGGAAEAPTGGQ